MRASSSLLFRLGQARIRRSVTEQLQRRLSGTRLPCRQWHTSGFETLPVTEKIEEETYSSYTNDLYYPAKIGQVLHLQYQVVGKLGYDTTSTVWMCRDLR